MEQDKKCYWCGEMTEGLGGNPGLWPVLVHNPGTEAGTLQTVHYKCLHAKLRKLEFLENKLKEIVQYKELV